MKFYMFLFAYFCSQSLFSQSTYDDTLFICKPKSKLYICDSTFNIKIQKDYKNSKYNKFLSFSCIDSQGREEFLISTFEQKNNSSFKVEYLVTEVSKEDSVYQKIYFDIESHLIKHITKYRIINGNIELIRITTYFSNGLVDHIKNYKLGRLEGIYWEYHSNGFLSVQGLYTKDKKIGKWYFYNKNGVKIKVIDYD